MTKNNLKLLDIDEHLRETHNKNYSKILNFCQEHDLILDLATSDVVVFIEDATGGRICIG